MKIGLIFKKEFQDKYGKKKEFFGNDIFIHSEGGWFSIRSGDSFDQIPTGVIQLIYLGEWNV